MYKFYGTDTIKRKSDVDDFRTMRVTLLTRIGSMTSYGIN